MLSLICWIHTRVCLGRAGEGAFFDIEMRPSRKTGKCAQVSYQGIVDVNAVHCGPTVVECACSSSISKPGANQAVPSFYLTVMPITTCTEGSSLSA